MSDLRPRLLSQYNRIMRFALLGVLTLAGLAAWRETATQLEQRQLVLSRRVAERAVELDSLLKVSRDGVAALVALADLRFRTLPPDDAPPSPLRLALAASRSDEGVDMDRPPVPWTNDDLGNVTGEIDPLDPDVAPELEMALALTSTLIAVRANNPAAASVYYLSNRAFINLVPWMPSSSYRWSAVLHERDFFRMGLPAANPLREAYWTPVYLDDFGHGLMVTVAKPVYEDGSFRGVVAVDVTLSQLSRFVEGWARDRPGVLRLVNESGQILADSSRPWVPGETTVRSLAQELPPALRPQAVRLIMGGTDGVQERAGHYVAANQLGHGPFTLVLVAGRAELIQPVLRGIAIAVTVLAAGLGVLLLTASWLVRREFVQPAQALVTFIEEESRGPALAMPKVHAAWKPWFETIRQVFGAHTQLVSLRHELDVARRMQQSILPTRFPERADIQLHGRMIPAKEVGGDFYDYFWLDERRIGLVVADVSDKGVPAALFMAVARTTLRATAASSLGPAQCLTQTNAMLAADNEQLTFVTVVYGVLDTTTGELRYANGGHNEPLLRNPDGRVEALPSPGGMALGVIEDAQYEEAVVQLSAGSALLLFSDGVTEAFDEHGRAFGDAAVQDVLTRAETADAEGIVAAVTGAVADFAGKAPQTDDMTCLALRFRGRA